MCLDTLSKTFPKNNREVKGYKVLTYNGSTGDQHFALDMDKWNRAQKPDDPLTNDNFKVYPWGFHIWASKKAAKEWASYGYNGDIIVRVTGRDLRCIGRQEGFKVYVCRQVRVTQKDFNRAIWSAS